jgi:excisionase family DNA binding protein
MSASSWLQLPGFEEAVTSVVENVERPADDGFLDTHGAAKYLGLTTRKAVYALVERGRLPYHRPAGRLLFDKGELRAWVAGRR